MMENRYIPYGRQSINEEDIEAVVEVLKSDFLTTGPKIEEFERKVCEYTGAKYAVAVSSGTAALHAACLAAGIKAGDEVITTPITFAATSNSILYCGGTPVFADINPVTYNIDIADIRKKITPKTKALIPVHYAGQPCDMDSIRKIAREYNLIVIEDAAHALGAGYRGKKIGSLSDMTTFSFHPVKHITTAEGGMITTNNKQLYTKLKLFRSHGITRDRELMVADEGGWYYEQQLLGYNYRISDIQCALGISQLKRLDYFVDRRCKIAEKYNKALSVSDNIICPMQLEDGSSWHLYVIQTVGIERKLLFDRLRARGIGVNIHYIPVYRHPYYREHGYADVYCENAERLYTKMISIPIYVELSDEEQDYVINAILEETQDQ